MSPQPNEDDATAAAATTTTPEVEKETPPAAAAPSDGGSSDNTGILKTLVLLLSLSTLGLLVATIILAVDDDSSDNDSEIVNPCAGQNPSLPNLACVIDAVEMTKEQSGVNVTKGYQGDRETDATPITGSYRDAGLCAVNVHWHLGTEHYSVGEYDELGSGPEASDSDERIGFQCSLYDANDEKFTKEYKWEHCIGMAVGQTYEVHWPHSAAGMCNSPWQYQTPFYDGVFCRDNVITDTAAQIGVQAQVFTIVNDEQYYYPDLFSGMIVDEATGKGTDKAIYTGSTTGTSRNNEMCSQYAPITWQVDRKCHLISASAFDKMCADMKAQGDDMKDDLHAHGSRELVADEHAADNHQARRQLLRGL